MPPIPDLVRVSKLDTQFCSSPEYTQHVQYVSGSTLKRVRVRKEERWRKKRGLGRGAFGVVWLEQCIHGDDGEGKVRAVKKIQKPEGNSYHRELEAIALFSHIKYEHCFVKSFGWYDDKNSIFIAMEYLPNGDLHKYLGSPLLESEGQHIVSQVLEGLCFMHQNGFIHRDLKPANILVVCKHPNWWVKIADFGVSTRTASQTLTGTPAFAAPEVLGYTDLEYTNAVDIWSLSVITFLILTGEMLFKDQRRLRQYVAGSFEFPSDVLLANNVSEQACQFIRSLMAPKSEDRPGAEESLQHPWLDCLTGPAASEHLRYSTITDVLKPPETLSYYSDAEASASWSTQDQTSAYKPHASASWSTQDQTSAYNPHASASWSTQDQTSAYNPHASASWSTQDQTSAYKPHASASWSTQDQTSASIPHSLAIRQSAPKPITSTGRLNSSKDRVTVYREANKLLLDNGFDIKALFNEQVALEGDIGTRALHWAARNGHEAVVRLLLEKGADVAAKSAIRWTALHLAALDGHEAAVRLLLEKGADVAAKEADGWTALHWAARIGHEAVVRLLLEKGADVAAKSAIGWTALHLAALGKRNEAAVRLLLEKGADVAAKEADGWTALHIAADNGHEAVVWLLLENGADVAAKEADGWTALHLAAQDGHEAVVRLLLEKGADVAAKLADRRTALHVATENGHEAVVRVLKDRKRPWYKII